MDILHYYELKQKYEENMKGRKNKIKKMDISNEKKKSKN